MKTVSGEIQSCTPVTISTAASVLSKFVSEETGASQAVNAYLRRATASLDELVRLHSKPDRKKRKHHKSESSAVTAGGEIPAGSIGATQEPIGIENGRKRVDSGNTLKVEGEKIRGEGNVGADNERKKIKKEKSDDFDEDRVGVKIKEEEVHDEGKLEKKKHKKKRKYGDNLGDAEVNGVGIRNGEAEKKLDIKEEVKRMDIVDERDENGLKMKMGEVKKEDRKKRKNREVEDGSRNEAAEEEQRSKKRKKARIGGEDHN